MVRDGSNPAGIIVGEDAIGCGSGEEDADGIVGSLSDKNKSSEFRSFPLYSTYNSTYNVIFSHIHYT